jgi:transporter family protein
MVCILLRLIKCCAMTWVFFSVLSAFFLGTYDVFKKTSLKANAVIPVLYAASFTSTIIFGVIVILSRFTPVLDGSIIFVPAIPPADLWYLFLKSGIVGTSWLFAYFALKYLPITIVTPIRATGPLWTLIGAILIFQESPNLMQWVGILTTLLFFYLFSFAGKKEGIIFKNNIWILLIILSTLAGSASGLYDKYLSLRYDRMVIQAWFSIFMAITLLLPLMLIWFPTRKKYEPFQWRWSIPMIALFLSVADFFYFYALSNEVALISMISILRRFSVIISFTLGALIFKEKNIKSKAYLLTGILIGIVLIIVGSTG